MRREFRLNLRRSKPMKGMIVKIPRSKVMVYPLAVSLELVKLPTTFCVTSLEQLSNMIVGHVPPNWSYMKGSSTVVLANLSSSSVVSHFFLCYHLWGSHVESNVRAEACTTRITLHVWEKADVCVCCLRYPRLSQQGTFTGNDDEQFHSLPQHGKGVFLDAKGTRMHK